VCRCDAPNGQLAFGFGLSNGFIGKTEQFMFNWHVPAGDVGVMNHFWITYPGKVDPGVVIRYYIDGESQASIKFQPSLACGVGYFDTKAPWGTQWFGHGAADGAWFHNFRIPFQKSILVSTQHMTADEGGFYLIVRGALNQPINIGGFIVPQNARMQLQIVTGTNTPALTYMDLAKVDAGNKGMLFLHTLQVQSGNMEFLEGCYHAYFSPTQEFPGLLLSTGTEDYYDSAWYFNAGQFQMPVSGFTHLKEDTRGVTWSAYRFHEMDPIRFTDGFRFQWRNGDQWDAAGMKCMLERPVMDMKLPPGSQAPTASNITSYVWLYVWK